MKTIMKLAFQGVLLATTSFGAVAAQAQPWGQYDRGDHRDQSDRRDQRDGRDQRDQRDQRDWNRDSHDRDNERSDNDRHDNGRHNGQRGDYRWHNYGGQYGYQGYRGRWRTGQRYDHWRDDHYWVRDYRAYNLPPPRSGYRYYRDDNGDIVMAAVASGIIGMILGSAISDDHHHRGY